jgi:hypothetical protein
MSAPISFPIWLLLVTMIGLPLHLLLKMKQAQTRLNYAALASLDISATMMICFMAALGSSQHFPDLLNDLKLSQSFGIVFGVPIGLVFRRLILSGERSISQDSGLTLLKRRER